MFSWRTPKVEVKIYDYNTTEDKDPYSLDNAVRLSRSTVLAARDKQPSSTSDRYIAYLYPDKYGDKQHFSKMIYPVMIDDSLDKGVLLETCSIANYLSHHGDSTQFIELKKWDNHHSQPIHRVTFQMLSLIPTCRDELRISETQLLQAIQETFLSSYPLCVGQVLMVSYPKEIEHPRYKHLSSIPPKMFTPTFKLKVTSINGETKLSDEPKIYSLTNESVMTLTKVPNVAHVYLLSQEEEQKWQEEETNQKRLEKKKWETPELLYPDELPKPEPLSSLLTQETIVSPNQLSFDFTRCGIGGNKEALRELVSQVFYSRALGEYSKMYGAKPAKGVLLYGPPGTGKTSIARAIASFFPESQVKLVNGPELKSKWQGESESALRELFVRPQLDWQLYKEKSPLHVIIFDEIDATFPKRGLRSGGTGVDDTMTSQMLSLMDGLANIENILVIGTTNRPELLDDALKRENRFSLMLEIGLPDLATRKEILELKTAQPRASHLLEEGMDFHYWAEKTAGFSGADLEQFVRMAQNYAQARNFDYDTETNTLKLKDCVREENKLEAVMLADFERSYVNCKPAHKIDKTAFNFNQDQFVVYHQPLQSIVDCYRSCIDKLSSHAFANKMSFIITGKTGTGKTDLAKYLAEISDFDSIKLIKPDHFLGKSIPAQLDILEDHFRQAMRIDRSIILLDNVEGILCASGDTLRKENAMVIKLTSLMNDCHSNNKCMIIATAQDAKALSRMGIMDLFDEKHHVSALSLSYDASLPLECIASSLHLKLVPSETEKKLSPMTLTIKQILYLLKKLADHEGCVDKAVFFESAMNLNVSKKIKWEKENQETASLSYLYNPSSSTRSI